MLNNPKVSIYKTDNPTYPELPPYNPNVDYPEYPFRNLEKLDKTNFAYESVRECFRVMDLDIQNYNHQNWNPLGSIISLNETVVIKPNAVLDHNQNRNETVFASITHGSVIRAIIDYVYVALKGTGKIIVADAPISNSNWENWKRITGLDEIVKLYKENLGFTIEVYDLRNLVHENWDGYAASTKKSYRVRDPNGYLEFDLGTESEFMDYSQKEISLLYGSEYNHNETVKHHINNNHKYYIAKTILAADVLISVPKLKVHQKVGVTLNLKGMVGAMGDKNYIPHYKMGRHNGDEYPDQGIIQNFLNAFRQWKYVKVAAKDNKMGDFLFSIVNFIHIYLQKIWKHYNIIILGNKDYFNITGGAWYGNETAWRMTLDLNRLVLYLDKNGRLNSTPQRKYISIIDGIIGGEKIGPLAPYAKHGGVIVCGFNPLATDIIASRLMGFDPMKIKTIFVGLQRDWLKTWECPIDNIPVASNEIEFINIAQDSKNKFLNFQPDRGWLGHIEI